MTGWLPTPVEELFGPEATAEESYDVLTVDVPAASWTEALSTARSTLGCTYFDWLSAVDEPGTGFRVSAHVVALSPVRRLLLRTTIPHTSPVLPTAVDIYAGAAWHERETHEMFGVRFEGHPGLDHLLLPENFEGHPLRKDFVLAARVAKAWPGAKEPGESAAGAGHGGPRRRQMLPPGVPDPNEWGPLKGQLPPAPARPTRGAPARTPGDRPVRRTRSVSEGSATQTATGSNPETQDGPPPTSTPPRRTRSTSEGSASQAAAGPTPDAADGPPPTSTPSRRTRSASEGSASQTAHTEAPDSPTARPPRRTRSASEGSASQAAAGPTSGAPDTPTPPRRARTASGGSASQRATPAPSTQPRRTAGSPDAPWHHARPAFDTPTAEPKPKPEQDAEPNPETETETETEAKAKAKAGAAPQPEPTPTPRSAPQPEPPSAPDDDNATSADDDNATSAEPAPAEPAPAEPAPAEPAATEPAATEPAPDDTPNPEPPTGGAQ
ncbi:NADH-quinone oxidoreductase subunit C [Streptomyces caniscabiei]|uniref:NADH-quinone oxidoreductase subunit C n=1 Tax=Streptomyces caniscabiei TaxID=2746961 RepID=UPI0038F6B8C1